MHGWSRCARVVLGVLACALLVVLAVIERPPNPDGASYVSIAGHYAEGRWDEAVNAYWSPLLSWLLAPVDAMGGDPLAAFAVVQGISALASAWLVGSLLRLLGASPMATCVVLLGITGLLVEVSASVITPDLLLCALLLGYVRLFADPRAATSVRWSAAAGVVGGLAYLAKAIALPVVAGHLLLVFAARLVAGRLDGRRGVAARGRRRVATAGVAAVVGLGAVAAPWIAAISVQTGSPTMSTAATANVSWSMPGARGSWMGEPTLRPPPTPHAYAAWEDPVAGEDPAVDERSPAPSVGGMLAVALRNVGIEVTGGGVAVGAAPGALLGLLMAIGLVVAVRQGVEARIVLAAALLHGAAVLTTYVELRYALTPILLLLMGIVPRVVERVGRRLSPEQERWLPVVAALVLVVPFVPRIAPLTAADHDHADLAERAAPVLMGRQVASDGEAPASMWVCVLAGCAWHGHPEPTDDGDALHVQLVDAGVELYLSWRSVASTAPTGADPVPGVGGDRFILYDLRAAGPSAAQPGARPLAQPRRAASSARRSSPDRP